MSVPALQMLREQYPYAHIAILARPWVAGLYAREPFCDELIPYEAASGWAGIRDKWALARKLRERSFDGAILFPNAFEAAALVRAAGIPVRVGYSRDGRGWLLSHPIPAPLPNELPKHQRFYYLELLKRARVVDGYPAIEEIRLSGAAAAAEAGRKRLQAACVRGRVIGVSPGAAYGGAKRWLADRFAQAAVQIAEELDATVAVFGSKQEATICEAVREQVETGGRTCLNFSGATSLAEFIELAAACAVYLTNDSGPMHIASALGVRTVAIFGATDDLATGPTGELSRVVREPVECSPCLLRECPIDHRCMTRVTADRVSHAALELFEIGKRTG
jgi:heptosyltransferase-2